MTQPRRRKITPLQDFRVCLPSGLIQLGGEDIPLKYVGMLCVIESVTVYCVEDQQSYVLAADWMHEQKELS